MPVPTQYIFRIAAAYVKTTADNTDIANGQVSNASWGAGYTIFKQNIRVYLKLAQNGRCAFCRCRVAVGTSWSNLEHLLSKTDYPQFKFDSDNLVYCCTKCNMSKIKKNPLASPNAVVSSQRLPTNSSDFLIINPYYDNFEDHIDFLDQIIITSKQSSSKGSTTIEMYNLFRPELAEERAYELQLDKKSLNENLVLRLTDNSIDQLVIDQIQNIIAQIPTWTV